MSKKPHATDAKVGENIRSLRVARGMSQEKLGEQLGITFQQVQKYEKGTNRVSASKLVQICTALQCSISDLFNGTDVAPTSDAPAAPIMSAQAMRLAILFDAIPEQTVRGHISGLVKSLTSSNKKEHADA